MVLQQLSPSLSIQMMLYTEMIQMSILWFLVAMTRHFQTYYRLHNDRIWANFIHI